MILYLDRGFDSLYRARERAARNRSFALFRKYWYGLNAEYSEPPSHAASRHSFLLGSEAVYKLEKYCVDSVGFDCEAKLRAVLVRTTEVVDQTGFLKFPAKRASK